MAQLTVPINVNLPENWLDLVIERVKQDGDYVLVTRCKDCKHWEYDVIFADGWCRGKQQGNPEWYCADAERRTDDTR